jgi:PncC family amidohydrolase
MDHLAATVNEVFELLLRRNATLGLAESCTGGQISAALVRQPGISKVFLGSLVAYHNDVKRDVLGVSATDLRIHGAVSREVALKMALGAQRQMGCTYAVSVTGIAGPAGGTPDKPIGTVMFAVVGPGVAKTSGSRFAGDREQIQRQSVEMALALLLAELRT